MRGVQTEPEDTMHARNSEEDFVQAIMELVKIDKSGYQQRRVHPFISDRLLLRLIRFLV